MRALKPTDSSNSSDRKPALEEIRTALRRGSPEEIRAIIAAGADIHYQADSGYGALIDAAHGRNVLRDGRLLELLDLLIAQGARLSDETKYAETATRVLSRIGRFDAVKRLLEAGANPDHVKWTPLIEAVAVGSLADVQEISSQAPHLLETRDWWERTPWLIAIQTGDIAKAELLRASGADTAARGRCGKPPLFHAIEGHHPPMLRWLIDSVKLDVGQTDDFGDTALMTAVGADDLECVDLLIRNGADIAIDNHGTALHRATSRPIIMRLLEAGADPSEVTSAGQRAILNLPESTESISLSPSTGKEKMWHRRFGVSNPERMDAPFWQAMIRSGASAYSARRQFQNHDIDEGTPVWCAHRFGQSLTLLPDGRAVQVAGEHEDSYDPDFCIYNDVFVHHQDGSIDIYGYPESVFPPTDFHTATLIGDSIYLIGSTGYLGRRRFGETPVYRLDTISWQIEKIFAGGDVPGWISKHRAEAVNEHEIRVWGGRVQTDGKSLNPTCAAHILDLENRVWRRDPTSTAG